MSKVAPTLKEKIRREAGNRCGYCLSRQELVLSVLEIDHLVPTGAGGSDDEDNLWLACRACNNAKSSQRDAVDPFTGQIVPLFNPRTQNWWDHFCWSTSGVEIIGITPIGRATVAALDLNNVISLMVRRNWVTAGWHPPHE
jgi:hypothetical protein